MNSIQSIRKDWDLIESLINERSRVLDVGCGEGDLIQQLEKNLQANVHGVEKNQGMALKGIAKGFSNGFMNIFRRELLRELLME